MGYTGRGHNWYSEKLIKVPQQDSPPQAIYWKWNRELWVRVTDIVALRVISLALNLERYRSRLHKAKIESILAS